MSVKRGMMRSGSTFAVLLLSPYTRAEGLHRCRPMVEASMLGSPSHDPLRPPFAITIAADWGSALEQSLRAVHDHCPACPSENVESPARNACARAAILH